MIYGDNPQKINEREDKLGLKTYSYVPQIIAVVQSGNLYVYAVGNPVMYADPSGEVTQKGNPPPPSSGYVPPKGKNQKNHGTKPKVDGKIKMETYGFPIERGMVLIEELGIQTTGMFKTRTVQGM